MKRSNALVCILDGKNLLLYRRSTRASYEPGKLALVGGRIEDKETPLEAVLREVTEEVSLEIKHQDLNFLTTIDQSNENEFVDTHIFYTRKWSGELCNNEPEKCEGLHWHPIDELPLDTIPVIHDIVRLIPDHGN